MAARNKEWLTDFTKSSVWCVGQPKVIGSAPLVVLHVVHDCRCRDVLCCSSTVTKVVQHFRKSPCSARPLQHGLYDELVMHTNAPSSGKIKSKTLERAVA